MTQNKKGFTLIELMVVMAIIAVLAVLMVGAIQLARNTATETTHRSNAKTIQTALESNYAKYKMYCGGSTGLTCTATGGVSLSAAATSLGGLTLGNSSCTATNELGGGRLTVSASAYYIKTANAACGAFTDSSDDLTIGTVTAPTF